MSISDFLNIYTEQGILSLRLENNKGVIIEFENIEESNTFRLDRIEAIKLSNKLYDMSKKMTDDNINIKWSKIL